MTANTGGESPKVVTRFAPSPTGFLHIGGARTALFNWLFARHHGGKALLRIEDTDRARSTQEAIDAILEGLDWLGLDYDAPPVFQTQQVDRHKEVAAKLLHAGHAYKCFSTAEELEEMRANQKANRLPQRYDGRWRDKSPSEAQPGSAFTVRLRTPNHGTTQIHDQVQGTVSVSNEELDDYIILRADGTPTYMLAAVVDDHDMGVTHVIRGDDHLNNAFRQLPIYHAMNKIEGNWAPPTYAHVPLIHGSDGAKMSKRHGALGVDSYRDDYGILPEALFNYLLRLGWSYGDREEIEINEAIRLFELGGVGRSPSRFDLKKLESLNGHYIRQAADERLAQICARILGNGVDSNLILAAMPVLKVRAKTILDLIEGSSFLFKKRPIEMTEKAETILDDGALYRLKLLSERLNQENDWTIDALEATTKALAEELELGLGKLAQPLRAALTGSTTSPGIFDVLVLLGREESLARINEQAKRIKD